MAHRVCQKCRRHLHRSKHDYDPYCPECMEKSYSSTFWRDELTEDERALIAPITASRQAREKQTINNQPFPISHRDIRRALLEEIGHKCWICGREQVSLFLDHDHLTGYVRGLLCPSCNRGIGMFVDDPALLQNAVVYLKSNYSHRHHVAYPHATYYWKGRRHR
jgi:hypothetical protein